MNRHLRKAVASFNSLSEVEALWAMARATSTRPRWRRLHPKAKEIPRPRSSSGGCLPGARPLARDGLTPFAPLKGNPLDTGSCAGVSKGSHSGCLPELYVVSNFQDRQERDYFKACCCRIFLDPVGEEHHRSASRNVPMDQPKSHEGKCGRAPSRNLTRTYPGVARSRNSCSKNKSNKPGGQYEH